MSLASNIVGAAWTAPVTEIAAASPSKGANILFSFPPASCVGRKSASSFRIFPIQRATTCRHSRQLPRLSRRWPESSASPSAVGFSSSTELPLSIEGPSGRYQPSAMTKAPASSPLSFLPAFHAGQRSESSSFRIFPIQTICRRSPLSQRSSRQWPESSTSRSAIGFSSSARLLGRSKISRHATRRPTRQRHLDRWRSTVTWRDESQCR